MKDWIKELCPEIADWQAELIAEEAKQRKPLTDEKIDRMTRERWGSKLLGAEVQVHREYARAIERAHGIGT